jgi:hypothetical protein
MRTYCPRANGGVELDWLNFYYGIHRNSSPSKYTFADIAVTYRRACTGSNSVKCSDSSSTPWADLAAAATAVHGAVKGLYWRSQGDTFGVNY